MRLTRAILLRLLYGLLSLLFISLVTFVADEIAPGDPATVRAGEKASAETVARLREEMGLNRPWPIRYVEFISRAAKLDFGESYVGVKEPVIDTLKKRVPMTARIAVAAILLAAIIGITLGTLASVWQNRAPDRSILTFSTLGVTLPSFVLAPILTALFVTTWDVLPLNWEIPEKQLGPEWMYLILPVAILAARPAAMLTRLTRASMIDTLQQEFIRTAVAKGVPSMRLLFKHALRNALLPVITAIGTSFGFLLTGSFVVERYFTIPGLGSMVIEAIQQGDTPKIQAGILVTGMLFILVNLVVDLLLPILDPRIRESQV